MICCDLEAARDRSIVATGYDEGLGRRLADLPDKQDVTLTRDRFQRRRTQPESKVATKN